MEGTPPFIQEIVDPTARYGPSALEVTIKIKNLKKNIGR